MCGIAGFYNRNADRNVAEQLARRLFHRGPDSHGVYANHEVTLVHTRLSIIDLSAAASQPYRYKHLVLSFNGEIYNYAEVRDKLISLGYEFISNSDTEVLIKAFHYWGESAVDYFIGMFAFAIYNEQTEALWLCRDRLGVKPLYYVWDKGCLTFASELKALYPLIRDKRINGAALNGYFRYGFIPGEHSIYEAVYKVPPGTFIRVDKTGMHKRKYWNPSAQINEDYSETDWIEELEQTMISAFKYRMVSDVPVGIFLSGGVDSSLVAAILKRHHGPIRSFTIGFTESRFNEAGYARTIADHLGLQHTEEILTMSAAKEMLYKFYDVFDEPFADTSAIPTACVTQLAKNHGVKVVLSADGGDELFGGYSHYGQALRYWQKLESVPLPLRRFLAKGTKLIFPEAIRQLVLAYNAEHRVYALEEILSSGTLISMFESMIGNQTNREIQRLTGFSSTALADIPEKRSAPLKQMMHWDLKNFLADDLLVKIDRTTMHYGIECREPLLDHRLVEMTMSIPARYIQKFGTPKYLERKVLDRYLPREYFDRRKQGFSIPIFQWFSDDLDNLFKTYLSTDNIKRIGLLDSNEVEREVRKYQSYKHRQKEYNIEKMWRLLSFAMWWEKYQTA